MKQHSVSAFVFVAAFFGGCAADPRADFAAVQQSVAARSGGKRLQWMRDKAGAADSTREVQALLKRQLTADTAVQIALLNNRSIQAELEELGIARADYLQALLPGNPNFSGFLRYPDRPPFGANI